MCGWTGHNQGNLPLRVCEAARPSAWFSGKFCPQGDIRGKEFLPRDCAQKWVPPKAWRFCATRIYFFPLPVSLPSITFHLG